MHSSLVLPPTDRPLPRKAWQRPGVRAMLIAGLTALLALLTHRLSVGERTTRLPVGKLTFSSVTTGIFHDDTPLRAHVRSRGTVYLDAQAGGRVERVLVHAGDLLTEGQVLIELSNSQWQLDVLEREARIVESVSQLESYQTQLEQNRIANLRVAAQIDYDIVRLRRALDRRTQLPATSLEPVEKLDQLRDELNFNQALHPLQQESNQRQEQLRAEQIPQIREQLKFLQQDLRMTRDQLDKLFVRAPVRGRLTALSAEVGESHAVGTRFGEITPDEGFKLSAPIDEYFLGRVHVGQAAHANLHGETVGLTVERVYPQVKNGRFDIDLAFVDGSPGALTPGETVEGRLTLGADQPAVLLANGPFMDQTAGTWAFVLQKGGRAASRRPITVGRHNAEQLEIIDGLEAGDRVLVSSYDQLTHIDRIDIIR